MNTLNIQFICLVALTFFVVCFRMLGVGFKPFATGMAVIIVVWGITGFIALLTFTRLGISGGLSKLSVGGVIATVMAVCFYVWLGSTLLQSARVPPIHHISTDLDKPPAFDKIVSLRADTHNSLVLTEEVAEQQRQHYGHIQPLVLNQTNAEVFDAAVSLANRLGWHVQHQDSGKGLIEASATSGIFGFVDDVVIRIQAQGAGSLVDLRSVSRVGKSDLGVNAKRVDSFLTRLKAQFVN